MYTRLEKCITLCAQGAIAPEEPFMAYHVLLALLAQRGVAAKGTRGSKVESRSSRIGLPAAATGRVLQSDDHVPQSTGRAPQSSAIGSARSTQGRQAGGCDNSTASRSPTGCSDAVNGTGSVLSSGAFGSERSIRGLKASKGKEDLLNGTGSPQAGSDLESRLAAIPHAPAMSSSRPGTTASQQDYDDLKAALDAVIGEERNQVTTSTLRGD
jgi:hypothetical protein